MQNQSNLTRILTDLGNGNDQAVNKLLPLVYDELRNIAQRSLQSERKDHTLQATALVHEAYLKLVDQKDVRWRDRAHFFAIAAQAIRRILVDHARSRNRDKRGGRYNKIPLDQDIGIISNHSYDLVALDDAISKLGKQNSRKAKVVEMRFFGGATTVEIAEVLGVTTRSIEQDWRFARAWLFRELSDTQD